MKLTFRTRNWHDHGKDQSGPMIWLDGLDLPLFRHFPVHFVEHFKDPRYPAEDVDTSQSPIVFPWARMKADLDGADGNWASRSYLKANGQDGICSRNSDAKANSNPAAVSKTLGGSAERLDAGTSSPGTRETASSVYHVIEGNGSTEIDGQKITWTRGDTFCIPSWMKYQHSANSEETVYLYRFDDKPMLKALGFYRTEGMDTESLVSQ